MAAAVPTGSPARVHERFDPLRLVLVSLLASVVALRELPRVDALGGLPALRLIALAGTSRPRFLKAHDASVLLDNAVIKSIADAHDRTPAQVLIAWHVQRGISTIPKTITPARLRENLAAAEVEMTKTELERIAGLDKHWRLIAGAFWAVEGGPWTLETIWDGP